MAKKRKSRTSEPGQPQIVEEIPPPQPEPVEEPVVKVEEDVEDHQEEEVEEFEEIEEEVEEEDENADAEENEEGSEEEDNLTAIDNNLVNGDNALTVIYENESTDNLLEPFSKDQLMALLKEAVAKHPDLIESISKVADADPAHRKVFVHGLGWDTTTETIKSIFGKYGEIEDCRAVADKVSGKSKGYAFILYKHRTGARKALQEPQKQIGNRVTSCQLASTGPVPAPPPTGAPPASEYTQKKIYVSNVGADIDPQKLSEFFSKWGEIDEGPLGLDKQTGKPRGFCFFVYKSVESARKALEEPHKNFEGHTLHCQKAVDGVKTGKQQQQSYGGNVSQQPHHHQQQQYYGHQAKKGKYSGGSSGGRSAGHLMAPAGGSNVGFNPAMATGPALNPALGQALTALLSTQGAGMGIGNFLGGYAAPQGVQPMMNNAGYGASVAGGYGGYQNPQMGSQGGTRPHQGGGYHGGHGH